MNECIFCKIVNNEAPRELVFENENVTAIVPIETASKGHTLLIPRIHSENILDIEEKNLIELSTTMRTLAKYLVRENSATGINLINSSGKDAHQTVFHFHFHLIPRYPNDDVDKWLINHL